jgi:benzoate/toluate 1,2-dioxygenase alpha subunit
MNEPLKIKIDSMMEEDGDRGVYRVNRRAFTDPEIFEAEMKYIFEGNWIYAAHESQLEKANDFYTLHAGRQPVVLVRSKQGTIDGFINSCTHRGARLCRSKRGNKAVFTCPFHGWSFRSSGELLKVKKPEGAGYSECFNAGSEYNLKRIPRVESYRGFIFISLSDDVLPLADYLGDSRKIIDLMVDQAPDGCEILKGSSTYTYKGNWKLQAENGADGYHIDSVHWNYVATNARRKTGHSLNNIEAMDVAGLTDQKGGFYAFANGHMMLWGKWADPSTRPNFKRHADYVRAFGQGKADWMVNNFRNLCVYPNLFLMDQTSSQIRVWRPISVDQTEVTIYCIAPRGEPADDRARRIRQYEDFFNATGMATPDDLAEFRECQIGYAGTSLPWSDISRGSQHWIQGADEEAKMLGIDPRLSGRKMEDEGLYVVHHRHWKEYLLESIRKS